MSSIDIRRPHQLSPAEARALIDRVAARMREKFDLQSQWQNEDALTFNRPGIDGKIEVAADEVRVSARLGMLFAPLKGMIEQEIRRKLDEHFA